MLMHSKNFTRLLISLSIVMMVVVSACQKDAAVTDTDIKKNSLGTDSANVSSVVLSPGNYLATAGTLRVVINDSTYTFDAGKDSIAFINVHEGDNNNYFGITAINKQHTLSFGISASGFANSSINAGVAGSQLLLNPDERKPLQQYSLSKFAGQKDFGAITIDKYRQGNQLAKGSFVTFLAKDEKANTPFYRVTGNFDLQLK
jgi:hypothetical protein